MSPCKFRARKYSSEDAMHNIIARNYINGVMSVPFRAKLHSERHPFQVQTRLSCYRVDANSQCEFLASARLPAIARKRNRYVRRVSARVAQTTISGFPLEYAEILRVHLSVS